MKNQILLKNGQKRFTLIVFYDGWCPLCTSIKSKIEKWDWLNLIEMKSLRDEKNIENIGIPLASLEKEMHAKVVGTNQIFKGIDALAAIAIRIPVLIPTWPLLKISSFIGIGKWFYSIIASKRKIIPVGNCNAHHCSIKSNFK